jgi:hypothetical protein
MEGIVRRDVKAGEFVVHMHRINLSHSFNMLHIPFYVVRVSGGNAFHWHEGSYLAFVVRI